MENNIEISREEYFELKLSFEKLQLLEAGGVDNWEWYSESLYPEDDEVGDIEHIESRLKLKIFGDYHNGE